MHPVLRMCVALALGAGAISADAHQPIFSDGSAASAGSAISLENVQISRVIYHEATNNARQLWITFSIDQPQTLRLQLGVPEIDRLADFAPELFLLGPGLPNLDAPFDLPAERGGRRFTPAADPPVFDEEFTGTRSWMLVEEDVDLPEAGTYYVVALAPEDATGKLWVALGREEVFGFEDIVELPAIIQRVRAFHEIDPGLGLPCVALPVVAALAAAPLLYVRRRNRDCR